MYWEGFQLIILFIGLIIIPINFYHGPKSGMNLRFGFNTTLAAFEILFDLLYLIDVILTFFTGFVDRKSDAIYLQTAVIASKYMATFGFYMDILCSISTMTIFSIFYQVNQNEVWSWLRIIGAIKIFRLKRFLLYLHHICEILRHYYYFKLMIQYFLLVIITLHWLTCFYIMFMQNNSIYGTKQDYIIHSYEYELLIIFDYPDLYVYVHNFITGYLLSISPTSGVGSSFDTRMYTLPDVINFIVYSSIGFILNNVLMILLIRLFTSLNSTEAKYHSIMSQLLKYMRLKSLPESMRARFIGYYDYRFEKNYFREATIMGMLSDSLRHEINLHSCRSLIQNVSILRDLPPDIISEVVFHLKHEVYLSHDVIVKADSVGNCMYFIANGSVAVMTPTGREICHLQDGSYFGEIALIAEEQRRSANVVAIEICEVYRLDRSHFTNCFQKNSQFYKKIKQIAQERKEKTVLLEELHKKYLFDRCLANMRPSTRSMLGFPLNTTSAVYKHP